MNFRDTGFTHEEYAKYLKSKKWKLLRQQAFIRAGYVCELCRRNYRLQTHHKKYPEVLGDESIDDLVVVCLDCHRLAHPDPKYSAPEIARKGIHEASRHGAPKVFTTAEISEYEKKFANT